MLFIDTQYRFYFIVKRLKNAFLMYIYKVRIRNFDKSKICLWFTTGRGVRGGLWSKNSFLGKIRFKSYIIKNQSRKSKSKFFTFSWPLEGGGGQPKRSAWQLFPRFFLTLRKGPFPYRFWTAKSAFLSAFLGTFISKSTFFALFLALLKVLILLLELYFALFFALFLVALFWALFVVFVCFL